MTDSADNSHTSGQESDTGYYAVDAQRVIRVFEVFQMRPSHFTAGGQSGAQGVYYAARDIVKGRTGNRWGHHTPRALKSFCHFTQSENGTLLPWRELVEHRDFYDGKEGAGRRTGNVLLTENRLRLNYETMTSLRQRAGLNQAQLAEKAALPLRFVEMLENGDWDSVTEETARTIAGALGIDEGALFADLPEPVQPDSAAVPDGPPAAMPGASKAPGTRRMRPVLLVFITGLLLWAGYQFHVRSQHPAKEPEQVSADISKAPVSEPEQAPWHDTATGHVRLSGCWNWSNGAYIVIDAQGVARNGPFSGTWKAVNEADRNYTLTWPSFVDTLTLSADGSTLSGTNNYGLPVSATRKSGDAAGVEGAWLWNSGVTMIVRPDASISGGAFSGSWRKADSKWVFEWPMVDDISLAADGLSLSTRNQFGVATAKRDANCEGG